MLAGFVAAGASLLAAGSAKAVSGVDLFDDRTARDRGFDLIYEARDLDLPQNQRDGLTQARSNLDLTKKRVKESEARIDNDLLPSIQQSLREAVATTRSISVDLFPPVLHNDGLPDALGWIAGWARRKFGLAVMVDAELAADPDGLDTRILMFESARELVFNAVKHAGVAKVKVDLRLEPGDRVQLTVSDEGRGFAVQDRDGSPNGNLGLGLFSIQQRINLMGGKMIVDSKPGAGARIRLTVPRRAAKSDPAQSGA